MAFDKVTPTPPTGNRPLMRDYWPKYRKRVFIIIISVQSGIIISVMLAMQLTRIINLDFYPFFIYLLLALTILNIVTLALVNILGKPFRDLVKAIVLVAGEPTALTPPNPNDYEYENDGFREILQFIYEKAASDDVPVKAPETIDGFVKDGLEKTNTGIVILDKDHKIVYHNRTAPVSMGAKHDYELDLIFPDDDKFEDWLEKGVKNKLSDEHLWPRVADRLPGENDRRIFDVAASYHKNATAETILTMFEHTKDYMPEEDDLDFISFAAHELRGPITVIRGYLDVIDEELSSKMEPDQKELMQRLIVASNRLTSYVNNILNAARYDRRHLKLHLAEETVRHIYDLISDDMQLRASAQNRILVTDIPESIPTVAADANAVGEVLSNLIDNAIKYSNEGSLVHVVARTIPGFVEISVVDRGIGMPSNILPNLFHKFYRSHRSRETVSGTGIGLYICRAIVSSHGGTITARSIENEGSTFTFTLPIYDTVADKLVTNSGSNESLIEKGGGWIKNHSMYKG